MTDDYEYVQFHHPLGEAIPVAAPPEGIAIRQMAGEREAAAWAALHRAAFESDAMTEGWRARIPNAPHHSPGLDLVAETADGLLVGYCLGWWEAAHRQGQVEPLGIAPTYQGRGVGRALLCELLRRFEALGAERVLVETESARSRALHIYESVGFAPRFRVVRKGRCAE